MEPVTPEQTDPILTLVLIAISAIFSLLTAGALWLKKKGLEQTERATGIKASDGASKTIDQIITTVIAYAEEQARKYARGLSTSAPATGADKLQVAKSAARSIAPAGILESVSEEQLEILIEAKLQSLRPSMSPPSLPPVPRSSLPPPPSIPSGFTLPTPVPPRRNP